MLEEPLRILWFHGFTATPSDGEQMGGQFLRDERVDDPGLIGKFKTLKAKPKPHPKKRDAALIRSS